MRRLATTIFRAVQCWNTVGTIRNNVATMLKRSVGSYELSTVTSLKKRALGVCRFIPAD